MKQRRAISWLLGPDGRETVVCADRRGTWIGLLGTAWRRRCLARVPCRWALWVAVQLYAVWLVCQEGGTSVAGPWRRVGEAFATSPGKDHRSSSSSDIQATRVARPEAGTGGRRCVSACVSACLREMPIG